MDRGHGECVLLVSPNGNYAEVLSKQGSSLVVLTGCGQEITTDVAEFNILEAKPVKAQRITKANGEVVYFAEVSGSTPDLYMGGQRRPGCAIFSERRKWV